MHEDRWLKIERKSKSRVEQEEEERRRLKWVSEPRTVIKLPNQ
jgi:hypothetical protein